MLKIIQPETAEELEAVKDLFREYAASLPFALDFQDFKKELADFPGEYSPPKGCLLLALKDGSATGCTAFRGLDKNVCEMKRLYVRPRYRGKGIGRKLANALIEAAGQRGYRKMRLDTVSEMVSANRLYRSLGFEEIPPYRYNPLESALFFELKLNQRSQ